MKLSDWARLQGVHYQTAWRWFRDGRMPVPAYQTETGTILVQEPDDEASQGRTVVYARVSSSDQRDSLDSQVGRVMTWCARNDVSVDEVVTEVGSGLNGNRRKLTRILADSDVGVIVVEHRDRLARFGVEHLTAALSAQGRRIEVIDDGEVEDDLVSDMIDVLTSMCARLYGRRGARARAQRAVECAADG